MKLLRFGRAGKEKPGVLDRAGRIRDLSGEIDDITPEQLSDKALKAIKAIDIESLPLVKGTPRIGVPVNGIRQVVAIGLNYRKHAEEAGMKVPTEPVVFFKAVTSLSGPNDAIVLPEHSKATDWEVELALVIGKTARRVPKDKALAFVAGYTIANDVSERSWQLERGGQWDKGKGFDTFCPLGPWLVTRDEVEDPQALQMELRINGTLKQNESTADMIFNVREIIAYCSRFMTLLPGDVIVTGTPSGIGWSAEPRRMLKPADRVHLKITGLGEQEQTVKATAAR